MVCRFRSVSFSSAENSAAGSVTAYPKVEQILKEYDVVIGLEVHCQLATASKIFCTSDNSFGAPPNTNIDPTCAGLPGALPVVNEGCVDLAIRLGLATHAQIQPVSVFVRKNYFYPDLPKGYQITQLEHPVCTNGYVELSSGKKVRIDRIQLEEDAGKSLHVGAASLVDYNRSGVGLIEVVGAPDLSSPEEATEYLKKLHGLVVHLDISDGDLERGNFRCDANVSLKPKGSTQLGQRTEIKNVNSFKYLEKAVAFEIERHYEILRAGEKIVMETRGYDSDKNETFSQRSKEGAHDYRYFPEPDLPPLIVSSARVERVRGEMPELPESKAARFISEFKIPDYDARVITAIRRNSIYFEALVKSLHGAVEPKTISNYFMTDVLRAVKLKAENLGVAVDELSEIPISVDDSKELLLLIADGSISGRQAKEVFEEMLTSGVSPKKIVSEKGLAQVSDDQAIYAVVEKVLSESPEQLEAWINGRDKLFGFFVGQAMKAGKGQLNPMRLNEVLKQALEAKKGRA